MRVIAQSAVVSQPSYMHLGYIAAASFDIHRPLTGVGICTVIAGLLLAGKLKKVGGCYSVILRRPIGWAIAGLCAAALGTCLVCTASYTPRASLASPQANTSGRMAAIIRKINQRKDEGLAPLTDLAELGLDKSATQDGWFKQMRLQQPAPQKTAPSLLISAGPDGTFGTDDDITEPL